MHSNADLNCDAVPKSESRKLAGQASEMPVSEELGNFAMDLGGSATSQIRDNWDVKAERRSSDMPAQAFSVA
jgi:hypothetical protein